MERLIYTAVSGAELNQTALRVSANNLANVNTPGFKADIEQAQAMMIAGDGFRTRYQAQLLPVFTNLANGPVQQTGRDLDIVLSDGGFLAIADANGNEAYTRAGNLQVDADGRLMLNGYAVQGEQGDIVLPEFGDIDISSDGTINLLPIGGGVIAQEGRLKMVSVGDDTLVKGLDGLLRPQQQEQLPADLTITLRTGALEGANVNAVEEMVNTMNISRQFEMNIRMMKTADELAVAGNKLVSGNS
ncbi:flagellar basal-body rod protein FlgF [Rheinheimera pacifica]|jgi:flagellar basal-body rod protein FlgF|uniref:flagellar basal body rod protein FlgF n=1 Tax=Rheinheimera pacifica TaxID=173990 RepID=UPI0021679700|nr:flagellar basal body rod protein FlgF [Rheinheimera pacifica]MCS4308928.1 flagellar basal-body rod protein FlgF [Rheinheimera pacifica]